MGIALAFMPLAVTAAQEAYSLTVDGLACPFCASKSSSLRSKGWNR